jgi:hypothetical protein
MEYKFENTNFSDLDRKFAKRKFNRSQVVRRINIKELIIKFMALWSTAIFCIDYDINNELMYTEIEFNKKSKQKIENNDQFKIEEILRTLIYIIAKLGYSPFKKFHYVFFKEDEKKSYYFDTTTFSKINLNFFNYLLSHQIKDFLSKTEENNFYMRLKNANVHITKGKEYLFVKSYMTQEEENEIRSLSSCISQLRNYLYAHENNDSNLLSKINLKSLDRNLIDFKLGASD